MFPDQENVNYGIEGTKPTVDQYGNTIFPSTQNPAIVNPNTLNASIAAPKLKLVYKTLEVNTVQGSVSETLKLDSKIKFITGIALSTNKDDLIGNVRSLLSINGSEVFPEDFQASLLVSSTIVRPDERFLQLNYEPGNGIVKVVIKDSSNPFTAQKLVFTVKCLSE
jgi:hypothetical protein